MKNKDTRWVAEFSDIQGCGHASKFSDWEEAIKRDAYKGNRGWFPLGVYDDLDQAAAAIEVYRASRKKGGGDE